MEDTVTMNTEALVNAALKEFIGKKVNEAAGTTLLQPTTWVYGHGMFSYCGGNELLSALVTDDHLSTWLGTLGSDTDPHPYKIIGWLGPYGTGAGTPCWQRTEQCGDSPRVEYGKCELLTCFGEVSFSGADLSLLQVGLRGCDVEPRYYIRGPHAGTRINNEQEWQLAMAAAVLKQAFERMCVVGNSQVNAFDWDGLQRHINAPLYDYRTGLRCQDSEPTIYAWGNVAMTKTICEVLRDIVRRIRERGNYLGGINPTDMALVMTPLMRDALIDFVACGCGPCTGTTAEPVSVDALAVQRERARLATGGNFGMGIFEVDGVPISILTSGWIPQTSAAPHFCSDIYVLTRRVGGAQILYLENQDFSRTLSGLSTPVGELVPGARITDGGRALIHSKNVNECFQQTVYMKARMVNRAPWLQGRVTDVCAPFNIPPITPIPGDDYFFAGNPPLNAAAYASLPYTYGPCGGPEDW